jgi:hypothetical protein
MGFRQREFFQLPEGTRGCRAPLSRLALGRLLVCTSRGPFVLEPAAAEATDGAKVLRPIFASQNGSDGDSNSATSPIPAEYEVIACGLVGHGQDDSPYEICVAVAVPSITSPDDLPAGRLLIFDCDADLKLRSDGASALAPKQEIVLRFMPLDMYVDPERGLIACACSDRGIFLERSKGPNELWREADEGTSSDITRLIMKHWPPSGSHPLCLRICAAGEAGAGPGAAFGCGNGRLRLVRDASSPAMDSFADGPILALSDLSYTSVGALSVVALVSLEHLLVLTLTPEGDLIQRFLKVPDLGQGDALLCADWADGRVYLGSYFGAIITCAWPPRPGPWSTLGKVGHSLWDSLGTPLSAPEIASPPQPPPPPPPSSPPPPHPYSSSHTFEASVPPGGSAPNNWLDVVCIQHVAHSVYGLANRMDPHQGLHELAVATFDAVYTLDMDADVSAAAACEALDSLLKLQSAHRECHSA